MSFVILLALLTFSELCGGFLFPTKLADTKLLPHEMKSLSPVNHVEKIFKSVPSEYLPIVFKAARINGISPLLIAAVIHVESRGKIRATSAAGARGLMQVMPFHARFCKLRNTEELYDPELNILCGSAVLGEAVRNYGIMNGIKVYNGGEKCAFKMRCKETENYVPQIMGILGGKPV